MSRQISHALLALVVLVCAACDRTDPADAQAGEVRPWKERLADLDGYDPDAFDSDKSGTWPTTRTQAVALVIHGMDEESKQLVRDTGRGDLIAFHHTWGQGIRNSLGLWRGTVQLTRDCGAGEPDGASMAIIEGVWEALQEGLGGNSHD